MTTPADRDTGALREALARLLCALGAILTGGFSGLSAAFNALGVPTRDGHTLTWMIVGLSAALSVSLLAHALRAFPSRARTALASERTSHADSV